MRHCPKCGCDLADQYEDSDPTGYHEGFTDGKEVGIEAGERFWKNAAEFWKAAVESERYAHAERDLALCQAVLRRFDDSDPTPVVDALLRSIIAQVDASLEGGDVNDTARTSRSPSQGRQTISGHVTSLGGEEAGAPESSPKMLDVDEQAGRRASAEPPGDLDLAEPHDCKRNGCRVCWLNGWVDGQQAEKQRAAGIMRMALEGATSPEAVDQLMQDYIAEADAQRGKGGKP